MSVDEAAQASIQGLQKDVAVIRTDIAEFKQDFKHHCDDDRKDMTTVFAFINQWRGTVSIIKWLVTALVGVASAHTIRHW